MSEELQFINVYKSPSCQDKDRSSINEKFTLSVLIDENKTPFAGFIFGLLIILVSIYVIYTSTATQYEGVLIFIGGIIMSISLWFAKDDIVGYMSNDIIQRCLRY